ncbi:MAG: hypothetical protein V9G08_13025 [Dermatophilaceae bacterium]
MNGHVAGSEGRREAIVPAAATDTGQRRRNRGQYLLTALLTAIATALMTRLWRADLSAPFFYEGDSVSSAAHVKATLEYGWYEYQPDLAAPVGQVYHVFPFSDNLHLALMRLVPTDALHWPIVFNSYYLLAFPACAVAALWFFRRVGLAAWTAVPFAVLFAVAPYHFVRSENHFFLAAYFTVPLALAPIVDAVRGLPLWGPRPGATGWTRWLTGSAALNALLLAAVATATAYYAVLAGVLLAGAGLGAFVRTRSWKRLAGVAAAIAFTLAVLVVNVLPDVLYSRSHPGAADAFVRQRGETEIYSFKLASLLLPAPGHPIPLLAKVRAWYDSQYPLASELPALGTFAGVAFVLVILVWFVRLVTVAETGPLALVAAPDRRTVADLSYLTLLAFLCATMGGFGTFVSFVSTSVRGWNRMAIFMSAMLLAVLGLVLQGMLGAFERRRAQRTGRQRLSVRVVAAACLVLAGVFDQSLAMAVPPYAASHASWRSDEAFVRDLEHRLPDRAMVFQVPYVAFPESGMDLGVFDADQLKLSLHSTRLRWSGGSFKGQPDTQWQPKVSGLPADQAVRLLAALQFDAVVIDRNATKDRGAALEAAYTAATRATGQASADGRWVVFPLDRPRAQLQGSASPAQIADLRERVLRGEV